MPEATDKIYRSWPHGPPIYSQANPGHSRDITQNPDWNYSLFDCCDPGSLCLMSWCLPCLTFGKTQARNHDPTLNGFSYCNADCTIFTGLGFIYSHWIIQTIRRGEMRERYGIKGSCCGDCCATFFCSCCALVQEEKEAELRTRAELGYQMTPGMEYK